MPNEKSPRSSATAKKATAGRAARSANANREEPVSTAEPTSATARNDVIQGNNVIDADGIRRRAYELYEQRGRLEGFHEEDWQRAEQELREGKKSA